MSGSELQLLVQMLNGISTNMQSGFDRVDAKLEQMIPRPEFAAYQEAVALRLVALERGHETSMADHKAIRTEAELIETKLDAKIAAVAVDVAANETDRLREFKALYIKVWWMLGGAAVSVGTGVLLAYINSQP